MASGKLKIIVDGDVSGATQALNGLSAQIPGWAGKMKAGFAAAGVAIGAALVKGVGDALANEQATDKIAARMLLSDEDAQRLGDVAGGIYRDAWGESFGQVVDVAGRVMQDLNVALDDVQFESVTTGVLDIANAFDVDLGEVIRATSALLRNNLAPNAESALDLITRGLSDSGIAGDDLLDTLSEYSNQFASMGLDGPAAMDLIVKALDGGARSSDGAADAIKELYLRITEDAPGPNKALADLGLNAEALRASIAEGGPAAQEAYRLVFEAISSIDDPTEQARIAQELLGGTFEQVGLDAIEAMGSAETALGDLEGATDDLSATLNDNLGVVWEGIKRKALGALTDIGEAIVSWAEDVKTTFEEGGLGAVLDLIGEQLGNIADKIIAWAADVDWGAVAKTIADGILTFGTKVVEGLAAIGEAILGAIADFFANTDWAAVATSIATGIASFSEEAVRLSGDAALAVVQGIAGFFTSTDWSAVATSIATGIASFSEEAVRLSGVAALAVVQGIADFFTTTDWSGVATAIGTGIASFSEEATRLSNAALLEIVDGFVTFFTTTDWVRVHTAIIEGMLDFQVASMDAVGAAAEKVHEALYQAFLAVNWVDVSTAIVEGIVEFGTLLPGRIGEALAPSIPTLIQFGRDMADHIKSGLEEGASNLFDNFLALAGLDRLPPEAYQAGLEIASEIGAGIGAGVGFVQAGVDAAMDPLSVARIAASEEGRLIGLEFATEVGNGIQAGVGLVQSGVDAAIQVLIDAKAEAEREGNEAGLAFAEAIGAGIQAGIGLVQSGVDAALQVLADGESEASDSGTVLGTTFAQMIGQAISNGVGLVQSAVDAVLQPLEAAKDPAGTSGDTAGAAFSVGVGAGIAAQAGVVASAVTTSIIGALKAGEAPAGAAGQTTGAAFATQTGAGISAGGGLVRSAVESVVAMMRGGEAGAFAAGTATGNAFNTGLQNGINAAVSAVQSGVTLIQRAINSITGANITNTITTRQTTYRQTITQPPLFYNQGGAVPGPRTQQVPAVLHGGEYVLSADVVDRIKNGRPSRGAAGAELGAAAGSGGSAGVTINVHALSADPYVIGEAVQDAIRAYTRHNGALDLSA